MKVLASWLFHAKYCIAKIAIKIGCYEFVTVEFLIKY